MEALAARIERGRCEHRSHWANGAQRLMQSHKNMLVDLSLRQSLENNRAKMTLRSELVPPSQARKVAQRPSTVPALPPPRQRPSKLHAH